MIAELRRQFNARWTEAAHERVLAEIEGELGERPDFAIAETPCFFPSEVLERMIAAGQEMMASLLGNATYLEASGEAIPEEFRVAEPTGVQPPNFLTADFGFVREADGSLGFRLVELQAFPSVFGFQDVLSAAQSRAFGLEGEVRWLFDDMDRASYWRLLGEVLLGGHEPEHVVLLEVDPERQKTRVDFRTYERRLGIQTVDTREVRQVGRRLEYLRNGRWIPIHRIFNRAIADEMQRIGARPGFDYRSDFDVEWAGHPNWYFRASKFSLPFLHHPSVPRAVLLSDYLADPAKLPVELAETVLKPLFSFAGKGIRFAPTIEELRAVAPEERRSYLLQERVYFEPLIETPCGLTQAEVRIMLMARDGQSLQPAISMVRLGRGLMMGVDHNRGQRWVGGTGAFFPVPKVTYED